VSDRAQIALALLALALAELAAFLVLGHC